jgi:hypothetical protein
MFKGLSFSEASHNWKVGVTSRTRVDNLPGVDSYAASSTFSDSRS